MKRNIPPNITAILDGNIIEEEDNEQEIESTDVYAGDQKIPETEYQLEISLHAISGILAPETMGVWRNIGKQPLVVLINSGSTHNFD